MGDADGRAGADSPGPDAGTTADATADAASRIARLQRILFGADASEAERLAAAAELEALQRSEADAAAARSALEAVAGAGAGARAERSALHVLREHPAEGPDASTAFAPPEPSTPADARGIRWAIAAGAVALALGLGVGWQLGGRSVPPPPEVASTVGPDAPASAVPATTVQLAETSLLGAISRPPVESDALDPAWHQTYGIDVSSARRLLSRPDGLMVFGALRGDDVCLIASYPGGDGGPACSTSGIVYSEGLRTTVTSETTATTVRWRPDGTVELTPAGERVAEPGFTGDTTESAE